MCGLNVRRERSENLMWRQNDECGQPVFARYMNVSKKLGSDWEHGVKKPGGPALEEVGSLEGKVRFSVCGSFLVIALIERAICTNGGYSVFGECPCLV